MSQSGGPGAGAADTRKPERRQTGKKAQPDAARDDEVEEAIKAAPLKPKSKASVPSAPMVTNRLRLLEEDHVAEPPSPKASSKTSPLASPAMLDAASESTKFRMTYTPDLLVALVRSMIMHRVGDPDYRGASYDTTWETIIHESPWDAYAAKGYTWRQLYNKGKEIIRDYADQINGEKYHTGGGSPKRPSWWAQCEKELDTLMTWRATAAAARLEVSEKEKAIEAQKLITDTALAELAMGAQAERAMPSEQRVAARAKRREETRDSASESEARGKLSPKSMRDASLVALQQLVAPRTETAADAELKRRKMDLKERQLALQEAELQERIAERKARDVRDAGIQELLLRALLPAPK